MIKAIAKLFGSASSSRIDALSLQVVEASVENVCQLVRGQVACMKLSEARGYVRARAASIVRRQSRLAIGGHPGADLAWTDVVARTAIERLEDNGDHGISPIYNVLSANYLIPKHRGLL